MNTAYADFLHRRTHDARDGFAPIEMPGALFDFQSHLVEWALRRGRAAIFADCGLGKTPMQLAWADNVVRHTNGRVLILTPLAVAHQTVAEAEKFGLPAVRSHGGELTGPVVVANYERLHHFWPGDFAGVVLDESSILKSYDGMIRGAVTEFMRKIRYRLLATATAAPNDFIEVGTSSEALGELGHMDMLNRFFKNEQGNSATGRMYGEQVKWRLKGHAETPFWRWVSSWARAVRRPSDLGFEDGPFILPQLEEREEVVPIETPPDGMLFALPAVGLKEQRDERRRTVEERCAAVARLVDHPDPALIWCHLNTEAETLMRMIPDAVEVSGADSDEAKEEKFVAFASGQVRALVTKPKIGAFGLNFQHCAHVVTFPSHSYEQYYQGVRRCWRFGQTRPVRVDIVTTEGDKNVALNLQRKARQADEMFQRLVLHMRDALTIAPRGHTTHPVEVPSWMQCRTS